MRHDRMDEVRLALFIAAIVRATKRAESDGARSKEVSDGPGTIELARRALEDAKASRIATWIDLDPIAREVLVFVCGGAERSNEAEQTEAGRIRGEDPGLVPSGCVASPGADAPKAKRIPTEGAMEVARLLWSDLRTTMMSEERIVRAIAVTLDGVRDGAISSALHGRRVERLRKAFMGWTIEDIEHDLADWKPHT